VVRWGQRFERVRFLDHFQERIYEHGTSHLATNLESNPFMSSVNGKVDLSSITQARVEGNGNLLVPTVSDDLNCLAGDSSEIAVIYGQVYSTVNPSVVVAAGVARVSPF
jgi:hypothetical protein